MKKKRALPFGYTLQNGQLVISEDEAKVVKDIFQAYIGGSSMLELADLMTHKQIPYTEKRLIWNKNLIARIITDRRYAGTDGFEPIVDDQDFREAEICKQNRRTKTPCSDNGPVGLISKKAICAACHSDMVRNFENRNRQKVCWRCLNSTCGITAKYLNDEILPSRVTDVLNTLIENPDILITEDSTETVQKIRDKTTSEFARMLDDSYSDEEQILETLRRHVTSAYDSLPTPMEANRNRVVAEFKRAKVQQDFQTDLFTETVEKVCIREDGSVTLLLKDGTEI